jgi:hypothetical protein
MPTSTSPGQAFNAQLAALDSQQNVATAYVGAPIIGKASWCPAARL